MPASSPPRDTRRCARGGSTLLPSRRRTVARASHTSVAVMRVRTTMPDGDARDDGLRSAAPMPPPVAAPTTQSGTACARAATSVHGWEALPLAAPPASLGFPLPPLAPGDGGTQSNKSSTLYATSTVPRQRSRDGGWRASVYNSKSGAAPRLPPASRSNGVSRAPGAVADTAAAAALGVHRHMGSPPLLLPLPPSRRYALPGPPAAACTAANESTVWGGTPAARRRGVVGCGVGMPSCTSASTSSTENRGSPVMAAREDDPVVRKGKHTQPCVTSSRPVVAFRAGGGGSSCKQRIEPTGRLHRKLGSSGTGAPDGSGDGAGLEAAPPPPPPLPLDVAAP